MKFGQALLIAAAIVVGSLAIVEDAEAGKRWRRGGFYRSTPAKRWSPPKSRPAYYFGGDRGEIEAARNREAWYNHAFNGWQPYFFH